MAPSKDVAVAGSSALTSISPDQTLKASKALLAHIKKAAKQKSDESTKRNLLEDEDEGVETPIWLTLTTKRHIADKARLQPGKIALPHSLNTNESTTICLITAEPQRAYKDIVASEEFPAELGKRITRVIDFGKLKAKFGQYEAQRKLFSEHDIFLGDDRIINRLPKVLGKTFFKTTQKRPIPVMLQAKAPKVDGKRVKRTKTEGTVNAGTPADIAKEVEKALSSALVSLAPTTNTAIRVGYASWTPEQVAANVEAVASALVEKWVPQKWRNMKSIYIKGPESTALPIWLTDELWLDDKDVIAEDEETKAIKAAEKANIGKKRKSLDGKEEVESPAPKKKSKKQVPQGDDEKLDKQIADRKSRLRKQKVVAKKSMD
ncbi:ribosomal protein L1p/L10e family-domain-containing protein [Dactylonectria estremocensis]|uniref:Ribosomal protein L1p/L10e family-domain-containing protein n=1 Tax=Dactylonectria estremocensis TaxID=1079267 RepID=A0A9P9JI07_9HYPO|nr:ribosomal protein L1p/L10e family-domain-containing protein [Dactylonectria estremocensis]